MKSTPSSFIKHFEEARSRTGSPCVHKGDWGCFPNKQRRGYHRALLATSIEAHFRSILLYRSINTFCPEEQSFTFCSLKTKRILVVLFSFLSDDFIQCFLHYELHSHIFLAALSSKIVRQFNLQFSHDMFQHPYLS